MIDIIIIAWILWGTIYGLRIHVLFLVGDFCAILLVTWLYQSLAMLAVSEVTWQKYKHAVVDFYLWLEPLQSVQLQGDRLEHIIVDIFSYVLLILFLFAALGIFRNLVGAFSETMMKKSIVNAILGCLRNALIATMLLALLPRPILKTYWLGEIMKDSIFMLLF
ncbi:hypothetical protein BHU72_12870 [Desulfuribacillus stibiiarsenatis]|uniref:Colicin V production protein n=1 Tax=Desulfuribacillus stibiiarsenatis TaxID=1390249 RepID=A0A1E5L8P3_9FIRM|nr:hypothetical protein [Desulfuribacillus stibiiarsenatis]OEH86501.1 hypothetical protein BHU72_12870 [Desulfuribacillus stibiiarsenatis]